MPLGAVLALCFMLLTDFMPWTVQCRYRARAVLFPVFFLWEYQLACAAAICSTSIAEQGAGKESLPLFMLWAKWNASSAVCWYISWSVLSWARYTWFSCMKEREDPWCLLDCFSFLDTFMHAEIIKTKERLLVVRSRVLCIHRLVMGLEIKSPSIKEHLRCLWLNPST